MGSTTPETVTVTRPRLVGLLAVALIAGTVLPTALSAVLSDSGGTTVVPSPTTGGNGPDVGEIRVGPDPAGPTNTRNGIGVGFAHNRAGATAAATNLILTIEQAGQATRTDAVAAYQTLASAAAAPDLGADMGAVWDSIHAGLDVNAPPGAALFIRAIPIGHNLTRYSEERATVEIWTLTLVVAPGGARPIATWETATVELVWEPDHGPDLGAGAEGRSDWRVWSVATRAGPAAGWAAVPVTNVNQFLTEMTELEGYHYVANH